MPEIAVVNRDNHNEIYARGFYGDNGKQTAQSMIDQGYWYNLLEQKDKHKVLVTIELPKLPKLSKKLKPTPVPGYDPAEDDKEMEFVDYVSGFYGLNGIYDMNANGKQIQAAVDELRKQTPALHYDSFDREKVRDILIEKFGLQMPPAPLRMELLA